MPTKILHAARVGRGHDVGRVGRQIQARMLETALRVIARVPLTSKVVIALLEVPGKLLVIGTTGTTLVALGEIPATSSAQLDSENHLTSSSFAATLDQQTHPSSDWDMSDDALAAMPEYIQRKISSMKQL